MIGRFPVLVDVDARLLCLDIELRLSPNTKCIIGRLYGAVDTQSVLDHYFAVGPGPSFDVLHIPFESFEKRIEEVLPELSLVVRLAVFRLVFGEPIDQVFNYLRHDWLCT